MIQIVFFSPMKNFCLHFNFAIHHNDYTKVFGSISSGICMLFKTKLNMPLYHMPLVAPIQNVVSKIWFSHHSKNHNKSIRSLFLFFYFGTGGLMKLCGKKFGNYQISFWLTTKLKTFIINELWEFTHLKIIFIANSN